MDGFFLVSSLWLMAVTAEINSLAMAGHWNRERQKHRGFLGGFPNPSPNLPRCTRPSAGTEYRDVKFSVLPAQAGNLFLCIFSSQNPKSFIRALKFPPGLGLKCVQIQLGGGKSSLEKLQPKACCKVPSGALVKRKRTRNYFCWGEKAPKSIGLLLVTWSVTSYWSSQSSNWNEIIKFLPWFSSKLLKWKFGSKYLKRLF